MNRVWMEVWALRLIWLVAPLVVGPPLGDALAELADTPRLIIEVALWAAWFAGFIATLVPHPISLTAIRILAPSIIGIAVIGGLTDRWSMGIASAIGYGVLVTILALLPSIGDVMVNGSAYGSERRMALRTPAVALLAAVPIGWVITFVGLVTWALLLANNWYLPAAVAFIIGAGAVWFGSRVLHQLARRWVVFVPAGFVLHDLFQLAEPVLLPRSSVAALGPATIGPQGTSEASESSTRLDLSAGSVGLALQVETIEPVSFGLRRGGRTEVERASQIVFSPTLPGALLSEARVRGIKIGESPGVG